MGYFIITDFSSAIIFSAIFIGVLIGGKVDNLAFIIGSLIIGGALLFRFLYTDFLSIIILPIALAFTAFIDEYGHDRMGKIKDSLMHWFFRYRFTFKFAIFMLAFYSVISLSHFAGFLLFDIAYDLNKTRR
jgi:hypothetical protein